MTKFKKKISKLKVSKYRNLSKLASDIDKIMQSQKGKSYRMINANKRRSKVYKAESAGPKDMFNIKLSIQLKVVAVA